MRWLVFFMLCAVPYVVSADSGTGLCLDVFCIGQSIRDTRFDQVDWIIPHDNEIEACEGVGCKPKVAFPWP
jgi:hypothetical protein